MFDVRLLCVFTVIRDGAALGGVQLATHLAHLVLMVPHPPPLIYGETWPVAGRRGVDLSLIPLFQALTPAGLSWITFPLHFSLGAMGHVRLPCLPAVWCGAANAKKWGGGRDPDI